MGEMVDSESRKAVYLSRRKAETLFPKTFGLLFAFQYRRLHGRRQRQADSAQALIF